MSRRTAVRTGFVSLLPYLLIGYLYVNIQMLQHKNSATMRFTPTQTTENRPLSAMTGDDVDMLHRVRVLEHKLNSYLGFGSDGDPFLSTRTPAKCTKKSRLTDYCSSDMSCHTSFQMCLDGFPGVDDDAAAVAKKKKHPEKSPCVVYDFGIREEPDFGVILASAPFGCEVHAFDPSPVTIKWFMSDGAKYLRNIPNWHFHSFGGGGADGSVVLREYNWNQVSIYHYPDKVLNPNNCTDDGRCRYDKFPAQTQHKLPVRSVSSIMKELEHKHIDVLKIDVEGSEFRMLESIIETGACRRIDQVLLEWHHYDFDLRYGANSLPILNVLTKLLAEECGLHQFWIHDPTGWPSNEKIYSEMGLVLRYNVAGYRRIKEEKKRQ